MRKSCFFLMSLLVVPVMAQPTARQWNAQVTAGWNLGNQLECLVSGQNGNSTAITCPANHMQAETAWGNPVVTQQTLQAVKNAGFNAVRIPVRWQCHITNAETMTVSADWMQRVKEVVDYAHGLGMKVIINTHHDMWLECRPTNQYKEENNQKLALLWTNIANAFKDYGYNLAFAGTNEVHVPNNWNAPTNENQEVQNSYNQTFVDAVRATGGNNSKRHLIVQTYNTSLDFGLNGFILPTDIDGNGNDYLSVEFHYYTPWDYCGEAKAYFWGTSYKGYTDVSYANEQHLRSDLNRAANVWGSKGLGIIIGEWGVTDHWDQATRISSIHANMTYYCQTLVSEARKLGIATFVWDNNAFGNGQEKFGIFDRHDAMNVRASWIVRGIQNGVATDVVSLKTSGPETDKMPVRTVLDKGRVMILRGDNRYNLIGIAYKN